MKPGKHQKSKQRRQDLCWKVHDRAQSFVLRSYHYAWVTLPERFYWLVPRSVVNNYCVLCTVKAKKREQKHRIKNFVEFHNHSPLLTVVWHTVTLVDQLQRTSALGDRIVLRKIDQTDFLPLKAFILQWQKHALCDFNITRTSTKIYP